MPLHLGPVLLRLLAAYCENKSEVQKNSFWARGLTYLHHSFLHNEKKLGGEVLPAEAHLKTKGYSPLLLLFAHITLYMPPRPTIHNRAEARKEIHDTLARVPLVRTTNRELLGFPSRRRRTLGSRRRSPRSCRRRPSPASAAADATRP